LYELQALLAVPDRADEILDGGFEIELYDIIEVIVDQPRDQLRLVNVLALGNEKRQQTSRRRTKNQHNE